MKWISGIIIILILLLGGVSCGESEPSIHGSKKPELPAGED